MSFGSPLVLLLLLAIPLLLSLYVREQRGRARAAAMFVAPRLTASVAPSSPGWRRHVPMLAFGLAVVVLIIAAARPQKSVARAIIDSQTADGRVSVLPCKLTIRW